MNRMVKTLEAVRIALCWALGLGAFFLIFSEEAPGEPLSTLIAGKAAGFALAWLGMLASVYGRKWIKLINAGSI